MSVVYSMFIKPVNKFHFHIIKICYFIFVNMNWFMISIYRMICKKEISLGNGEIAAVIIERLLINWNNIISISNSCSASKVITCNGKGERISKEQENKEKV